MLGVYNLTAVSFCLSPSLLLPPPFTEKIDVRDREQCGVYEQEKAGPGREPEDNYAGS